MAMSDYYNFDRDGMKRRGFGTTGTGWALEIPRGWNEAVGAGGDASALALGGAESAVPGVGWGMFAAEQGMGLAGKALSYMFGGQRKEQKEAKGDYKKDRARIEGSMDEDPYSLGQFNTFAVRGMHNFRATVAKQMADIADINAPDVMGAIGEETAVQGQNKMMDAFVNARMARFDKRARDRYTLLQASANRYAQAMG